MTKKDKEIVNILARRMAGVMRVAITDVVISRSYSIDGNYCVKLNGYNEEPVTFVNKWLVLRAYARAIWMVATVVFPFATKNTIIAMNE